MPRIYGIGNPLMDIVMGGTHGDLERLGVSPGSMNLVDYELQKEVLRTGRDPKRLPGGSAANTLRGVAFLAVSSGEPPIEVRYGGAVGTDKMGARFGRALSELSVEPRLAIVDAPTGSSAILVTPDFERTMFTHLGACRLFTADNLDEESLAGADWFHCTGYMWDTENQERTVHRAVEIAREHGTLVSFDIADPFVAERYRDRLVEYLPGRIDLLFGNEEELSRLTGTTGEPEEVARAAGRFAPTVALKIGKRGCVLVVGDEVHRIAAFPVETRDTTGAGDAFAGGFLYALLRGFDAEHAARLANRLAAAVVTVQGCRYEDLDGAAILSEGLDLSDR